MQLLLWLHISLNCKYKHCAHFQITHRKSITRKEVKKHQTRALHIYHCYGSMVRFKDKSLPYQSPVFIIFTNNLQNCHVLVHIIWVTSIKWEQNKVTWFLFKAGNTQIRQKLKSSTERMKLFLFFFFVRQYPSATQDTTVRGNSLLQSTAFDANKSFYIFHDSTWFWIFFTLQSFCI